MWSVGGPQQRETGQEKFRPKMPSICAAHHGKVWSRPWAGERGRKIETLLPHTGPRTAAVNKHNSPKRLLGNEPDQQ